MENTSNKYDIVIIGAGIGGLVSGCYMVKAGYKVLIIEKNNFVGGCCSSFVRRGFTFDVGPHYLCEYHSEGILYTILKELDINLNFKIIELTDLLVTPDYKIYFWKDVEKTVNYFMTLFPKEASKIKEFFDLVTSTSFATLIVKTKDKTFDDILEKYFNNSKLRSILGMLLLGNKGILPQFCSAIAGIVFYRKFIFGGGYYPIGGMGNLAKALLDKFLSLGGEVILGKEVKRIKVKNYEVEGVYLDKDIFIRSKYVISASDMRRTFLELIDQNFIDNGYIENLKISEPSLSAVVCYLGTKTSLKNKVESCGALWFFPTYNLNEIYNNMKQNILVEPCSLFVSFPSFHDEALAPSQDQETIILTSLINYQPREYWEDTKTEIMKILVNSTARVIPDLPQNIDYKILATPHTFFRYTFNYRGAIQGWNPSKFHEERLEKLRRIPIKRLFIVGHWSAYPHNSGMFQTLFSSRETIKKFLKEKQQ